AIPERRLLAGREDEPNARLQAQVLGDRRRLEVLLDEHVTDPARVPAARVAGAGGVRVDERHVDPLRERDTVGEAIGNVQTRLVLPLGRAILGPLEEAPVLELDAAETGLARCGARGRAEQQREQPRGQTGTSYSLHDRESSDRSAAVVYRRRAPDANARSRACPGRRNGVTSILT